MFLPKFERGVFMRAIQHDEDQRRALGGRRRKNLNIRVIMVIASDGPKPVSLGRYPDCGRTALGFILPIAAMGFFPEGSPGPERGHVVPPSSAPCVALGAGRRMRQKGASIPRAAR